MYAAPISYLASIVSYIRRALRERYENSGILDNYKIYLLFWQTTYWLPLSWGFCRGASAYAPVCHEEVAWPKRMETLLHPFSTRLEMRRVACIWEDMVYNLVGPLKSLRLAVNLNNQRWLEHSLAMRAGLTNHLWSIAEVLLAIPVPTNSV
jgi:hypothetical protein